MEKRSLDIWWVSRLAIYNPGVLQGEQGAHQPLLFLNKQGDNFENKTQHRITLDSWPIIIISMIIIMMVLSRTQEVDSTVSINQNVLPQIAGRKINSHNMMVIVLILRWWTTRRCSTWRSLPRSAFGSSRRFSTETFQSSTWWAYSQLSSIFHNYHQLFTIIINSFIHNHPLGQPEKGRRPLQNPGKVNFEKRTFQDWLNNPSKQTPLFHLVINSAIILSSPFRSAIVY